MAWFIIYSSGRIMDLLNSCLLVFKPLYPKHLEVNLSGRREAEFVTFKNK